MPPQPKKLEIPSINPNLTINGINLTTAIATVQIDAKADGSSTFYVVGRITDGNETDQLKSYLQNL
jgi:hypothetical protein